jgi:hypothetical protein
MCIVSYVTSGAASLNCSVSGPQSRSGRYGELKIFDPTRTRTPTSLVVQPVASRYTD